MKTTLNIDDGVMRQLKAAAAQRQTTMSALVEAGLRRILAEPTHGDAQSQPRTRLPSWRSGGFRVDIADPMPSTGRWKNSECWFSTSMRLHIATIRSPSTSTQ